eukprot:TRINITY_DN24827_c0_g1_i1.p1 TRINITY_DN24827_c0_g1~~TRINITY_DN24827_c0_g1_i1.p1  ORF type:complete len:266 (-),score=50.34 TRINITY_DN24827_c0_g1_i1:167-964(-)
MNTILLKCRKHNNWPALATVLEIIHNWEGSLAAHLNHLRLCFPNRTQEEGKATLQLLTYVLKSLFPDEIIEDKQTLIYMILNYWDTRHLPVYMLSDFIIDHLDILAPILGVILCENPTEFPLCVHFDTELYLHVTKAYLGVIENTYTKGKDKESELRLLSGIKQNLQKGIGEKDHISFRLTKASQRGEKEIAFTCGHHFSLSNFNSNILPEFQERVKLIMESNPILLQLFFSEYKQKNMNLSCPVCLYNHLQKVRHHQKVLTWEL